jgi:hypothetical protein
MAYPFWLASAVPSKRVGATQKNLLKNRVLDPPPRGAVKFGLNVPDVACGNAACG